MMTEDSYLTIASPSEAQYTEKRSRFLAFAYPATSEEEALAYVAELRRKYFDARHVCWAYKLGNKGERTRSNDDGEPSGTAGKPILGQITSLGLTQVFVAVVRYFGGVKLGTSGLIIAYREAAREALEAAEKKEEILFDELTVAFEYPLMGEVMRLVKDAGASILMQDFAESCRLTVSLRKTDAAILRDRFIAIYGVSVEDDKDSAESPE